jgi:uncharacterized repeat protein (TIGR01451 family)
MDIHQAIYSTVQRASKAVKQVLTLAALTVFTAPLTFAAPTLEFQSGIGGPVVNGPSIASQTVTFQVNTDNPAANTFIAPLTPVTVTLSLSNQQYALSAAESATLTPLVFGSTTTGPTLTGLPIFRPINSIAAPANSMFTAIPSDAAGTGLDVSVNGSIGVYVGARPLHNANLPTNGRYYYGDITYTFSRPLDNPVLHLSGLGGSFTQTDAFGVVASQLGFTSELELKSTAPAGLNISKLSGNAVFVVAGNKVFNTAANPSGSCTANFSACGSVVVSGTGVTSVTFRVYLRGDGGDAAWQGDLPTDNATGDQWYVAGVSVLSTADMSPAFSGLPTQVSPGTIYTGLHLKCTNANTAQTLDAVSPTCAPTVSVGTISGLSCSPNAPALLAPSGVIDCTFTYTAPGSQGGGDVVATDVMFTGLTTASNDINGGVTNGGNNQVTATAPMIDALDDGTALLPFYTAFAGQVASTPSVLLNDQLSNANVTLSNVAVTANGVGTFPAGGAALVINADGTVNVPAAAAQGNYTVPYKICTVPATTPLSCDTAIAYIQVGPPVQRIDLIKNAGTPAQVAPSAAGKVRFEVPYTYTVKNTSATITATNVQVVDNISLAYPAGVMLGIKTGTYIVSGVPACSPSSAAFNGAALISMLVGSTTLLPDESCVIKATALIEYASLSAALANQAVFNKNQAFANTALSPTAGATVALLAGVLTPSYPAGTLVKEVSAGNTVVMNADGSVTYSTTGGQTGNTSTNLPTATTGSQQLPSVSNGDNASSPATLVQLRPAALGIAKLAGVPIVDAVAGTVSIPYTYTLVNYGGSVVNRVKVTDDLAKAFAPIPAADIAMNSLAVSAAVDAGLQAVVCAGTNLSGVAAMNAATGLLTIGGVGGDVLGVDCKVTITLNVVITPRAVTGPVPITASGSFENTAKVDAFSGSTPSVGQLPLMDDSQSGVDPAGGTLGASTPIVPGGTNVGQPGSSTVPSSANPNTGATTGDPSGFGQNTRIMYPGVAVAKSASLVFNAADGAYNVKYSVLVQNTGAESLLNMQVIDDLTATFIGIPAGNITVSAAPAVTALVPGKSFPSASVTTIGVGAGSGNAGYTGQGVNSLFATNQVLGVGGVATIAFTVKVFPCSVLVVNMSACGSSNLKAGPFNNTAIASGTGSSTGVPVSDNSQNGTDPKGGDPMKSPSDPANNVPTPVILPTQQIDTVKNVGTPLQVASPVFGGVRYEVPYTFVVKNTSPVADATNVQLVDKLSAAYTTPSVATVTIKAGTFIANAAGSAGVCAAPATVFDGVSNIALLSGSATLKVNEQCVITLTALIDYATVGQAVAASGIVHDNLSFASTSSVPNVGPTLTGVGKLITPSTYPAGTLATDQSQGNAATLASVTTVTTLVPLPTTPNGDNAKPLTPTSVSLTPQVIDVVKSSGVPKQISANVFEVPYVMVVGNVGPNTPTVYNVRAQDNLARTFLSPAVVTVQSGSYAVTPKGTASAVVCAGNASYNGTTDSDLLSGTGDFAAGDSCEIRFTAVVDYGMNALPSGIKNNTTYASGMPVDGTPNPGYKLPSGDPAVPANAAVPPVGATTIDVSVTGNKVSPPPTLATPPGTKPSTPALPATPGFDAVPGEPTPTDFARNEISVAKSAGVPLQVGIAKFEVPYTVVVSNVSGPVVYNAQAQDNLKRTYPTAMSWAVKAAPVITANGGATCTPATVAYDGVLNTALLSGKDDLAATQGCTIKFVAVIGFSSARDIPKVKQDNTVYASGMGDDGTPNPGYTVPDAGTPLAPAGSTTVDQSTTGNPPVAGTPAGTPPADPVPSKGDVPTPTPVILTPQEINVIKTAGIPRQTSASSYDVPYTLVLKNTGTQATPNVQVIENFKRAFMTAQSFTMTQGSTVTAGFDSPALAAPVCTAAAAFNGTSQPALLSGSNVLLPGQYCVIRYVVNVQWSSKAAVPTTAQDNTVYASANLNPQAPGTTNLQTVPDSPSLPVTDPTTGTLTATDVSSDVKTINTPVAGIPPAVPGDLPVNPVNPADPAKPTPVSLVPAAIDVVKSVSSATGAKIVDGQTFEVPYVITVKNAGSVPAYNVQVSEFLRATFAQSNGASLPSLTNEGNSAAVIAVTKTSGNCTVASNFNGNSVPGLLSGTDTFAVGESCTMAFTVRVTYANASDVPTGKAQNNTAYASTTAINAGANPGYTYPSITTPNTLIAKPTEPANYVAIDLSNDGTTVPATGNPNSDPSNPTPVILNSGPDVKVMKTHTPSTFTVDNSGTYTITAGNVGYLPTAGVYTVVDTLPMGMTVKAVPTGSGWNCSSTKVGDTSVSCTSSTVIAPTMDSAVKAPGAVPGRQANWDTTHPITLLVDVAHSACLNVSATGQCMTVDNTVVIDGGGEFKDPYFTNDNGFKDPTPIQQASSLSGVVWQDVNHDRKFDSGETVVAGMLVEVLDKNGVVVGSAKSGKEGAYTVSGLVPGNDYTVRFSDPTTGGVVYGVPTVDHTAPLSAQVDTSVTGPSGTSTIASPSSLKVSLIAGKNLVNQSLPLDPSGVIYDSVTRLPIAGATVTITGPLGFNPAVHLVGGNTSGYSVLGASASMLSASSGSPLPGAYQFLLNNAAPAGTYTVKVTAPGYTSFTVGTATVDTASAIIPNTSGSIAPSGSGNTSVNKGNLNGNPPPVGDQDTTYYLAWNLKPISGSSVVNNHIPMDPAVQPKLLITKVGDRSSAEVGDSVRYTIKVKRVDSASYAIPMSQVLDSLPAGFRYIEGTAQLQVGSGQAVHLADPKGKPAPVLTFTTGAIGASGSASDTLTLTYRVRLGVGSQQGTGINRATATAGLGVNCQLPGALCSNEAQYKVKVTGGVFGTQACVIGKVYMDCNNNHMQDGTEMGIPGVRMYMQDGTSITSDVEGKYSVCDVDPKLNILVIDQTTLPRGSVMTTSASRNAGDAMSVFLDLKNGDMQRADFVETSCYDGVIQQVKARRGRDDAKGVVIKAGEENSYSNKVHDSETKPVNMVLPTVAR